MYSLVLVECLFHEFCVCISTVKHAKFTEKDETDAWGQGIGWECIIHLVNVPSLNFYMFIGVYLFVYSE